MDKDENLYITKEFKRIMSETQNNFSYEDKKRSKKIITEIIRDKLKGIGDIARIAELVNAELVKEPLLKEEVLPKDSIHLLESIIQDVLRTLQNGGYVKKFSEEDNIWEIYPSPQRIFGEGKAHVYVFYDHREKQEAEQRGSDIWLCNVGSTERPVKKRVDEQTNEWLISPTIGLIIKSDYHSELENKIQGILKVFDRQKRENKGKKLKGNEWFDTSPAEVIHIVKLISDFIPNLEQEAFAWLV